MAASAFLPQPRPENKKKEEKKTKLGNCEKRGRKPRRLNIKRFGLEKSLFSLLILELEMLSCSGCSHHLPLLRSAGNRAWTRHTS